jgi:poly-gamma-glutamate synthesis protein (capsule biosynthesis protein)
VKYHAPRSAVAAAKIASILMYNEFHYPQPVKGRYRITSSKKEKLKWAYRCWVRQLERAEKHSGIEAYFAGQELGFSLPPGWETECRMSVAAGGDLMAVDCITEHTTSHLFDGIREFYLKSDLTCANLESVVWDKAPLGRNQVYGQPPKMNTSEGMLDRFRQNGAGIDYFSMANNHCYDYGEEGLLATLDSVERCGALHSGTNRTQQEQESVLVIERNGIRVALLSYTCDMNGNAYGKKHLINEVRFNDEEPDLSLVERHVHKAAELGADVIIAFPHWGWEFEMYPHRNVIDAAHRMMEMGVDVILGSHPHVAQPMERYCCADGRQCLAVYSLGDFVSWHPLSRNSKLTYTVRFDLVKGTDADGKPA